MSLFEKIISFLMGLFLYLKGRWDQKEKEDLQTEEQRADMYNQADKIHEETQILKDSFSNDWDTIDRMREQAAAQNPGNTP